MGNQAEAQLWKRGKLQREAAQRALASLREKGAEINEYAPLLNTRREIQVFLSLIGEQELADELEAHLLEAALKIVGAALEREWE